MKQIFPFTKNLSDTEITEFKPVMLRTLASVVYHYDTIVAKYPQHPVLQSTMASESLRLKLKSLLATDFLDFNSKSLNRTGIDKKARRKEWRDRKMLAYMEGRPFNSSVANKADPRIDKIFSFVERQERMAANNESVSNDYTWPDGTHSPIPPDFVFPKCKIIAAWKFWNHGHKYNGDNFRKEVIAFKDLTNVMFKTLKNERKKYSKWVFVMRFITNELNRNLPSWPNEPEWKVNQHIMGIRNDKLKKKSDGTAIDVACYSVAYIYKLLKD